MTADTERTSPTPAQSPSQHSELADRLRAISKTLICQKDEPWPDQESRRVHFWRDKAIKAGADIAVLATTPIGEQQMPEYRCHSCKLIVQNPSYPDQCSLCKGTMFSELPFDYEPYRPALQAWLDSMKTGLSIASPMDNADLKHIRAGIAFAKAMPKRELPDEWIDAQWSALCRCSNREVLSAKFRQIILEAHGER